MDWYIFKWHKGKLRILWIVKYSCGYPFTWTEWIGVQAIWMVFDGLQLTYFDMLDTLMGKNEQTNIFEQLFLVVIYRVSLSNVECIHDDWWGIEDVLCGAGRNSDWTCLFYSRASQTDRETKTILQKVSKLGRCVIRLCK